MVADFRNISDSEFTLNGIEYKKTFIPVKVEGSDLVRVVNMYDSRMVLVRPTRFSDFQVDGQTFNSVESLIESLNDLVYSRVTFSESEKQAIYDEMQETQDIVAAIGSGEGGIMYDTLSQARAIDPAPVDGTIFQVSEKTDPDNAGVYTFQSEEPGGTRFEKEPFDFEEATSYLLDRSDLYETTDVVWEQGTINTGTGEDAHESAPNHPLRIRSQGFLPVVSGSMAVMLGKNQEALVCYYDDEFNFTGMESRDWGSPFIPIASSRKYFRVVVRWLGGDRIFRVEDNTALVSQGPIYAREERTALKSDLNSLRDVLYEGVLDIDFVNGTLRTNTGGEADGAEVYDTRLRSKEFIRADSISIKTSSSQEATLFMYNEDKEFLGFTDYRSSFEKVDDSYYIRPVVRYKDETPITPEDNSLMIYRSKLFLSDDDIDGVRERIEVLEDNLFISTHEIVSTEQGTFSPSNGGNLDRDTTVRTRFLEGGYIESIYVNQPNVLTVYWWDEDRQMIDRTDYANSYSNIEIPENSTFRVAITNSDNDIPITPEDVELNIITREERYALKGSGSGSSSDEVFTKYQPPLISSAPHGETLGYSFEQKQGLFEQILDDYPGTWTKEDIGPTYNGLHRVNAYTLTPESYTVTIAVTSHVHGNEKHNPTGFYALLSMISDTDLKHSFFNWIKENVRWIVVPFVSPMGYINDSRYVNGFNLNRNMDYDWAQIDDIKGDYPMSGQENQNVANFFMPIREEIDFHLDTHDFPSSASISYWIHQQEEFIWLREQEFVEDYLIRLNETNKRPSRYIAQGGTYTQYFTEVLGIPSMTPEHSTLWWADYPVDVQIAKATEQLAALVCMFANVHEERKGAPFYNKLIERSFCSEEFGISTWTFDQLETYFTNLDGWEAEDEFEGLMSYTLEPSSYTKTILVLSGITHDDKNSAFTLKAFMEEVIKEGDKLPMYVRDLKNVRIVVVPVLNGNPFFVPENDLENLVNGLQTKYSPDYSLVIRGVENDTEPDNLVVRSVNSTNLTRWSQENIERVVFGIEGIENYLTGRYSVAILNNPFENAFKFAHGVVQWVELITNDLASFNKEK